MRQLQETFDGNLKVPSTFAAPLGKALGSSRIVKREIGGWMPHQLMARCKGLRGSALDPFKNSDEAKAARPTAQYEQDIATLLANLSNETLPAAVQLAAVPEAVKGYGHVREQHLARANEARQQALAALLGNAPTGSAQLIASSMASGM